MIYLIITNRPEWSELSLQQYFKCSNKDTNLVVLDNGSGCDTYKKYGTYIHKPEMKSNTELFNFFAESDELNDHFILTDDDVIVNKYYVLELERNALIDQCRVCYTMAGLYSRSTKKYCFAPWRSKKVGTGVMVTHPLNMMAKWKGHPDGMLSYYHKLPDHLCVPVPVINFTHVIHNNNVVLREGNVCGDEVIPEWITEEDLKLIPD